MAGIYTSDKKEVKTLTTDKVVEGLQATINANKGEQTVETDGITFEVTGTTKDGETSFAITTNLKPAQFNILDDNGNGAYLITVNEKSNRKYKILFQLNGEEVTAKFVSGSVVDGDYTTKQPETQSQP